MEGNPDEVYRSLRMGLLLPMGTIKLPQTLQKTWKTAAGYVCGIIIIIIIIIMNDQALSGNTKGVCS